MSPRQVKAVTIDIVYVLVAILIVRFVAYSIRNRGKNELACPLSQRVAGILDQLANEMNVKLHPTKSLVIESGYHGADAFPRPFFVGGRIHYGGRVRIGCSVIQSLDDIALKGVLAHELAHLKKKHSAKALPFFVLSGAVAMYCIVSVYVIPFFLTIVVGILVLSIVSWHHEYEADAVAADCVGQKGMVYTLEHVTLVIHRRGDTLTHPSFAKRITHLSVVSSQGWSG